MRLMCFLVCCLLCVICCMDIERNAPCSCAYQRLLPGHLQQTMAAVHDGRVRWFVWEVHDVATGRRTGMRSLMWEPHTAPKHDAA